MCGNVRYRSEAPMLWAALCHCEDCQRAAGADYVSWFGLPKNKVSWTGTRGFHRSSDHAERSFCKTCGTPMSYETAKLPDEVHLYAPSLIDRSLYHPTAHIYCRETVPWFEGTHNLPRHIKSLNSELMT